MRLGHRTAVDDLRLGVILATALLAIPLWLPIVGGLLVCDALWARRARRRPRLVLVGSPSDGSFAIRGRCIVAMTGTSDRSRRTTLFVVK